MVAELGLSPEDKPYPRVAAVSSLVTFAVGAVIPLLSYLFGFSLLWIALLRRWDRPLRRRRAVQPVHSPLVVVRRLPAAALRRRRRRDHVPDRAGDRRGRRLRRVIPGRKVRRPRGAAESAPSGGGRSCRPGGPGRVERLDRPDVGGREPGEVGERRAGVDGHGAGTRPRQALQRPWPDGGTVPGVHQRGQDPAGGRGPAVGIHRRGHPAPVDLLLRMPRPDHRQGGGPSTWCARPSSMRRPVWFRDGAGRRRPGRPAASTARRARRRGRRSSDGRRGCRRFQRVQPVALRAVERQVSASRRRRGPRPGVPGVERATARRPSAVACSATRTTSRAAARHVLGGSRNCFAVAPVGSVAGESRLPGPRWCPGHRADRRPTDRSGSRSARRRPRRARPARRARRG